jgi:hypothetical protein
MRHAAHILLSTRRATPPCRAGQDAMRIPRGRRLGVSASTLSRLSSWRRRPPASCGQPAADPDLGPGGDRFRQEAFALGAFAGQFPRTAD